MQLTQSLFSDEYDELTDLTDAERGTARNWHEDFRGKTSFISHLEYQICLLFFIEKYDIVGRLLKQGEKASVYPIEESTVDGSNNKDNKKYE